MSKEGPEFGGSFFISMVSNTINVDFRKMFCFCMVFGFVFIRKNSCKLYRGFVDHTFSVYLNIVLDSFIF